MDLRRDFFKNLVQDRSKRILELGPLNRPIADKETYPNVYYCDIRSTEEVQSLYSGNEYLEVTGIKVDSETIVPIDFVVKEGYAITFEKVEKFDFVIASHVLEHMEDLISSLQDIGSVLKPGGIFCIIYPDKRYCFDHFRTSASFRDAYHVFRNGSTALAPMVFDFYYSVIPENNAYDFWKKDGILNRLPESSYKNAIEYYEQVLNGAKMDDVHYWPFTDMDFLKFLYDCTRAGLLPFHCISFRPCVQYDQQFMVALQYDQDILSHPEQAMKELIFWMERTLPDYYSSKDIEMLEANKRLRNRVSALGKNELVSVIMPAYNAEKYISMSIASVVQQTYENVELVIVDDGSTDGTLEIIKDWAYRYPDKVRFSAREKNGGTAAALNDAIELARGDYICWLSADDLYSDDMVESEVGFLKENKQYDAVFSRCAYIDENNQCLGEQTFRNVLGDYIQRGMPGIVSALLYLNFWQGCSLLAKAECFKQGERFNLDFKCAQDYDFWLRMAADYDIGYLDQINVFSRAHSEQSSKKMNCNLDEIIVFFHTLCREETIKKLLYKMGLRYTLDNIQPYILSRIQKYEKDEEELGVLNKALGAYLESIEKGRICFEHE